MNAAVRGGGKATHSTDQEKIEKSKKFGNREDMAGSALVLKPGGRSEGGLGLDESCIRDVELHLVLLSHFIFLKRFNWSAADLSSQNV